jgi:Asp-tRNA(Asn)/Glu-tRNA(Gln) amidotransferase A subunit family amidase
MPADLELSYMAAPELALRVRQRELSPVQIVENCLLRIEAVNAQLNCFCSIFHDEARADARAAEAAMRAGRSLGALHGVPVAIKDMTPIKGRTTTLGSRLHADWVPTEDALIVERLRAAGAIILGKTTTPEFAYSSITDSPLWGVTRNPWNPTHNAGGSSGGSAAAVATGCVALAEGSDMGGSIRIPASFCGVVGLKPSLGRIPFTILPSQFDSLPHFGPLARTIDGAALFLAAAGGPDDRDIQSQRVPVPIAIPTAYDARGLRIALSIDLGYYAVDPDVETAIRSAACMLREAGAAVEEVDLGWTSGINAAWNAHWAVFLASFYGAELDARRDEMDPSLVRLMETGRAMSAVDFKRLEIVRTAHWQRLAALLADHDALICPTTPVPAPPNGTPEHEFEFTDGDGRYHCLDMTAPFSFFGQCPALSVPAGFTQGGLPIGLQIVARRYDDATALRVGAVLERLKPWADKRPA